IILSDLEFPGFPDITPEDLIPGGGEPAPDYVKNIALLYEAALNRAADEPGMNFWIDSYESGWELHAIAEPHRNPRRLYLDGASSSQCEPRRTHGDAGLADRLAGLGPVGEEGFEAFVGQRVLDQSLERRGRHGGDVGADERGLLDVVHGADRCREDLGLEIIIVVDRADFRDQLHAVHAHVVDAADEGRDEGRAGLGGEQRLVGGKAQRDVDQPAFGRDRLAGLEAVERQRNLDADIVGDLRQDRGLAHHAVIVGRHHFGRDRAGDDGADFLRHLGDAAARLENQRRVGGDAVEQAEIVEFPDFLHVGCVDEELHGFLPWWFP